MDSKFTLFTSDSTNTVEGCTEFSCNKVSVKLNGSNNTVRFLGDINGSGSLGINVFGASEAFIEIGENIRVNRRLQISIVPSGSGQKSIGCKVVLGRTINFNGDVDIILSENDNMVSIGERCLFANNVSINTSDFHPIFDVDTRQRTNPASSVIIGEEVWVAANVHFLKGSEIADGSVVGAHSVVTKKFFESKIVVAGNPARVVRHNIKWKHANIWDELPL